MISSTTNSYTYICFLCTLSLCISCSAKDSITTGESIPDGADNYLESPGKKFQMGFFQRQRGSYLGIWYAMDPQTVVWVANRDKPVPDSTGVLTITEDGEAKVLDKQNTPYFTANAGVIYNKTFKLLDSGNAVLIDDMFSGTIRWQSFHFPTDTFLQGMRMDLNLKLTSWKNADDPATGSFVFQKDETMQYGIMNMTASYWKSGSGSMTKFDPNPMFPKAYYLLTNSTTRAKDSPLCKSNPTNIYCNESLYPTSKGYSRLLMDYTGKIQYYSRGDTDTDDAWVLEWEEPKNNCSIYQVCGPYALCDPSKLPICSCLDGFEPVSAADYSSGCKLKSDICGSGERDDFQNLSMIRVENPSLYYESDNASDCKNKCLENCRCYAYSYTLGRFRDRSSASDACWIWNTQLLNLRKDGTANISIRFSRSTKGDQTRGNLNPAERPPLHNSSSFLTRTRILVFSLAILVILLICSLSYTYYKRLVTRKHGSIERNNSERRAIELLDLDPSQKDDIEGIGVPFFQFETILAATDNFSDANKLGQGGFGPVYKGKLPEGLEVAVKRLSILSGQGLEEFRNEVILIAKLQHRNLVRLLGYSIKGNDKMLLYEYMPNKSLDAYIFDRQPSITLNWGKRYEIIVGIARGLLYLHQDSRLRIIHRDLKTSNILLDDELNPKISDFGLAKIVKDTEMEASTNRVIGTYGYMAPEYALDGLFSTKSDVFSFGVVVLEIISGRKNVGSSNSHQAINLLGYAWSLWKEDWPFELMDQKLVESSNSSEVLKCIIVGLLCVQEDPGDRPTMTNVVLMLVGDIASLPTPKQPAFVARRTMSSSSSSSYKPDQTHTSNAITFTVQEGR